METKTVTRTTVTVGGVELVIGYAYSIAEGGPWGFLQSLQKPSEYEGDLLYIMSPRGVPMYLIDDNGDIYSCSFVVNGDTGQYSVETDGTGLAMAVDGLFIADDNPIGHASDLVRVLS